MATKTAVKPAAKKKPAPAETITSKILTATGQKPQGKTETGYAFIHRLCSAITELDDDTYNALDADVLNWCEPAIKALSAKVPKPDKVPDLDGVSASEGADDDTGDPEAGDDDAGDPEAGDDDTGEDNGDGDDDAGEPEADDDAGEPEADDDAGEPDPPPPSPKRKPAPAKPAVAAKSGKKPAAAKEPDPPARTTIKPRGKAAAAPAPAPEVKRGRGRPRKEEANGEKPAAKAKPKANGITRARGSGGTYVVAELVAKYPEHSLDQIKAMAAKRGSTVKDSQVTQTRRFVQTIVSILKKNDMYKPFKAASK